MYIVMHTASHITTLTSCHWHVSYYIQFKTQYTIQQQRQYSPRCGRVEPCGNAHAAEFRQPAGIPLVCGQSQAPVRNVTRHGPARCGVDVTVDIHGELTLNHDGSGHAREQRLTVTNIGWTSRHDIRHDPGPMILTDQGYPIQVAAELFISLSQRPVTVSCVHLTVLMTADCRVCRGRCYSS